MMEADGSPPDICCDSGYYYYFYDAVGNVIGVLDEDHQFFRWEMDAFGNDLSGGNDFLDMDQPGPKEHLTGKMFDTATGLYYFAARWYDPEVGRFVSRDPANVLICTAYSAARHRATEGYVFVGNDPVSQSDVTGRFVRRPRRRDCKPEERQVLENARNQAIRRVQECGLCDKTAEKRLLNTLRRKTLHCADDFIDEDGASWCGDSFGGIIKVTTAGLNGECGCVESVVIHEAAHIALKTMREQKPIACELCAGCGQWWEYQQANMPGQDGEMLTTDNCRVSRGGEQSPY